MPSQAPCNPAGGPCWLKWLGTVSGAESSATTTYVASTVWTHHPALLVQNLPCSAHTEMYLKRGQTLGTNAIFYTVCRYHYFLSALFLSICSKRGCCHTQSVTQSRIEVTRHFQLWLVIQWIKYKYILYYRATQSILFTRHHIQALQQQSQL